MVEFQFPYIFKLFLVSFSLCLCLLRRYLSDLLKDNGDEFDATLMAINCLDSKEFYPSKQTYNGQVGYFYYPQLLYYFVASIVDLKFVSLLFSKFKAPDSYLAFNKFDFGSIFPSYSLKELSRISRFIFLVKFISGYLLPFLLLGSIGLIGLIKFDNSLLSIIFILASMILADQSLAHPGYSISGRNIGGVLYGLVCLFFIFIPQSISFPDLSPEAVSFFDNNLSHWTLNHTLLDQTLVLILSFALPVLFLSSQRGTQLIFSLLISLSVFSSKYIPIVAVAISISTFLLLQFPKLNYGRVFWVHFANRIHQYKWSQRTYGNFRFKLKSLRSKEFSEWINDVFFFKYITNYITPLKCYEKTNFLSIFFVHRIFIYLALILFFPLASFGISDSYTLWLKIILFASLVPCILIVFKPFQGYGSSEIYITGNLPYCYLSLLPVISILLTQSNFLLKYNWSLFVILLLIIVDLLGLLFRWFYSTLVLILSSIRYFTHPFVARSTDIYKYHRMCSTAVLDIFKQLPAQASISILAPEMYLFTFCDAISNYISFTHPHKKLEVPFQMIDNFTYGFYDDMKHFSIGPSAIAKINPDILLLDIRRPVSNYLFQQILSNSDGNNCILMQNDGPLVMISFNGKLRRKNN